MASFPDDDNGAILKCLSEHRFNFDVEHPVDFFALLYTDKEAQAVADIYRKHQADDKSITDIELRTGLDGKSFELVISKIMMVTHENVSKFERLLAVECRQHKGTTDGWGVLHDDGGETH